MLQSMESQRVGHDIATEQKKYSGEKVRMFLFLEFLAARLNM